MKTLLTLTLFMLSSYVLVAQKSLKETNGRLISELKYENLTGDPNLHPTWKNALVRFKNGKNTMMPVNIDLIAKTAFFKGENNEKLGFVDEISSVEFLDSLNKIPASKLFKLNDDYFIVVAEGKVPLYKKIWKTIWQDREYNAATINKTVVNRSAYFLFQDNKLVPVKTNKSLISALPGHKQELQQYVKNEKIDFNNDTDLKKVINYYNSL